MMNDSATIHKPVQLILDTDMGNDIDDALALAMIHALQRRGECDLRCIAVSKGNPYAAVYVDAVNTFYGYCHVPIGMATDGMTPEEGNFIRQVAELKKDTNELQFPRSRSDFKTYPDAVQELRRQLSIAADGEIVVLMIGFSTNLSRLFDSDPDEFSDLDGLKLFNKKVSHVVMMAAEFSPAVLADPEQKKPEFNIRLDIPAARRFVADCPRPIYFSGLEVGAGILYSADSLVTDYRWCSCHPVVEAYKRYLPMPYDRPTWDLTAVLFAVRPDRNYFGFSAPGTVEINEKGFARFCPHEEGLHRYLTVDDLQRARIGEAQMLLAAQPC